MGGDLSPYLFQGGVRGGYRLPLVKGVGGILPSAFVVARFAASQFGSRLSDALPGINLIEYIMDWRVVEMLQERDGGTA